MCRLARWAAFGLVGLGLLVSAYLLARTFALLANQHAEAYNICSVLFGPGCDEALTSGSSWYLGLPLAGWGVVYYVTLGTLLVLGAALGDRFRAQATAGACVLSILGASGSVALAGTMLGGWVSVCVLCLGVHAVNLILVPTLRVAADRGFGELFSAAARGAAFLVGRGGFGPEAAWRALGFVTALLVAVLAYQWVFLQSTLRLSAAARAAAPEEVVKAYEAAPRLDVPVSEDDPRLGPPDAPVKLVVFSSFQCPACRELAKDLDYLADHFAGQLAIIHKHYPLSTACNPAVTRDKQPRSCQAAYAAEAAHRQRKFWAYLKALFATDLSADEAALREIADRLSLDMEQFEADRRSPSVARRVRADVAVANALKIDGTPSVFLNGRRVKPLTPGALDILVHHLLGDHHAETDAQKR